MKFITLAIIFTFLTGCGQKTMPVWMTDKVENLKPYDSGPNTYTDNLKNDPDGSQKVDYFKRLIGKSRFHIEEALPVMPGNKYSLTKTIQTFRITHGHESYIAWVVVYKKIEVAIEYDGTMGDKAFRRGNALFWIWGLSGNPQTTEDTFKKHITAEFKALANIQ